MLVKKHGILRIPCFIKREIEKILLASVDSSLLPKTLFFNNLKEILYCGKEIKK